VNENSQSLAEEAPPCVRSVFVGRTREIAELTAGLDDAAARRGRLFLLVGEPGVGKTRLADEVAVHAHSRGIPTLWGRCWDGGDAPVYWPWMQVLRSYLAEYDSEGLSKRWDTTTRAIAQLLPELQASRVKGLSGIGHDSPQESDEARFELFDATATFLRRASARRPLLIILDDLHVADASSFRLLEFLGRQLRDSRLVIVGTYRDVEGRRTPELSRALGNLAREGRYIELHGFEERDVGAFITEAIGRPPRRSVVRAIYETTEGNPLFVDEIVRFLVAEGRLNNGDDLRPGSLGIPQGLREAIRRRIDVLSSDAKQILSVASVIGREFGLKLLARAVGWNTERLVDALEEAESYDIVAQPPMALGYYSFAHVLVRETFYYEVPTMRRIELHQRIGEALEAVYGEDEEAHLDGLAHHFFQSISEGGSEKAIRYCMKAAERNAKALAYEDAAEQYERALGAVAFDPPVDERARCDLLLSLGAVRWKAGDASRASRAFEDAVDLSRKLGDAQRFARAVLALAAGPKCLSSLYRVDVPLVALLEEALQGLGQEDSGLRAQVLGRLAVALHFGSNGAAQARAIYSQQAIEMGERLGDATVRLATVLDRQLSMLGPDNLVERTHAADEILRLASELGDRETMLRGRHLRVANFLELGSTEAVTEEIEACITLTRELRQPFPEWQTEALRGMRALLDGRFDDVERVGEIIRTAGERARCRVALGVAAGQRFVQYFVQGRLGELEHAVRVCAEEHPGVAACRASLAFLNSELGRERETRNEFERLAKDDFRDLPRDENWYATMWFLSMTCAYLRDSRRAAALYAQLLPYEDRCFVAPLASFSLGSVAAMLGVLAAATGRWDAGASHFESALRCDTDAENQPFQALTCVQYTDLLLARDAPGDRQRACELAKRAIDLSESLGMWRLKQAAEKIASAAAQPLAPTGNSFSKAGEFWTISYEGEAFHIKDSIGLRYIAYLLRAPGKKTPATEIVLFAEGVETESVSSMSHKEIAELGLQPAGLGDAGDVLDPQAEQAYRRRFEELEAEILEANAYHDLGRVERLGKERDFLVRELSAGVGVNGRSRKVASFAERARLNVTRAIRAAIDRIGEHSRPLAVHLGASIETGRFCSYRPDARLQVTWSL
jgi:tetratricopeptide (TPR) repeat protein